MEALITRGEVFMNPVSYFAALDDKSPRSDPYEGTAHCVKGEGATLSVQREGGWDLVGTLTGPITFRDDDLGRANMYCMHARRSLGLLNLQDLNFGDSYVLLLNPQEFLRRTVAAAAQVNRKLEYSLVEYVDRRTHTGSMGLFRKFDNHASESEFRMVLPNGDGRPFSLLLGDLRDIALIGATDERLKLEAKEARAGGGVGLPAAVPGSA